MKRLYFAMFLMFLCSSCARQYQIPEQYDLVEDCSEWNSCDEETEDER